jgi:hypothetical protein
MGGVYHRLLQPEIGDPRIGKARGQGKTAGGEEQFSTYISLKMRAAFSPARDRVGGLSSPPVRRIWLLGSAPSIRVMFRAVVMMLRFFRPVMHLASSVMVEPESRMIFSPDRAGIHPMAAAFVQGALVDLVGR